MPDQLDLMRQLHQDGEKIVMLVIDGLGGLPVEPGGPTELEAADTPHLDRLAAEGSTGLSMPIGHGIEPGSGAAHLSLFGYDPLCHIIGRGVLEALGIGFELHGGDVAARGNFCTVDEQGVIVDRRAGRIRTDECRRLTAKLQERTADLIPDGRVFVLPVRDYRFVLVLRGDGLGGHLTDTDPLLTGAKPLVVSDESGTAEGGRTADLVNRWVERARAALAAEPAANSLNLRSFGQRTRVPSFADVYGLRGAAIATYPMYRGVAALLGMRLLECAGDSPSEEVAALESSWRDFDFFFVHVKKTDSRGEDGDFAGKVREIEAIDAQLPRITALAPGVLAVTGDHSTPAALRQHTWHPVPTVLWGPRAMPDRVQRFGERDCACGYLGLFHATALMPQAMAHAGRLKRFGA